MFRLSLLLHLFAILLSAADPLVVARPTQLTAGCGSGAGTLAKLEPGQEVRLRFALAGSDNRCYSVSSTVDGRRVAGYVAKADVQGLDAYEQDLRTATAARPSQGRTSTAARSAPSVTPDLPPTNVAPAGRSAELLATLRKAIEAQHDQRPDRILEILDQGDVPDDDRDVTVLRGQAYLYLTRPSEALVVLQPALKRNPNDPDLLGLVGFAYSQQDRPKLALEHLDRALKIQHNPSYERLRKNVAREAESGAAGKAFGSRFTIRYEGDALPDDKARALVKEFEGEVNRIQFRLGCRTTDRLPVIVRTMAGYRQASGVAQWAGGHYDGRIHIAVPPSGDADGHVRETFAHEFTHACLSRKGVFPLWLHEGLAQRLSGRVVSEQGRQQLAMLSQAEQLPRLNQLAGSWARLGDQAAMIAYGLAAYAVETLYEKHGDDGVRSLIHSPTRIPGEAKKLDAAIRERLR